MPIRSLRHAFLLLSVLAFRFPGHVCAAEAVSVLEYFQVEEGSASRAGAVHVLGADEELNAFATLSVYVNPKMLDALLSLSENYLVVAELRKAGESVWNRVAVVDALTRAVRPTGSSDDESGQSVRSVFVDSTALLSSPYVREGDPAIVLFLNDATVGKRYHQHLGRLVDHDRPLMSIDLQEVYLLTTGSAPTRYTARDGDWVRLRFLRLVHEANKELDLATLLSLTDTSVIRSLASLRRGHPEVDGRFSSRDDIAAWLDSVAKKDPSVTARKDVLLTNYAALSDAGKQLTGHLLRTRQTPDGLRIADRLNPGASVSYQIREFGYKMNVSPFIGLGSRTGNDYAVDDFNPIKRTPSLGSNVYLSYAGRKKGVPLIINGLLPSIHVSLLSVQQPTEAQFTLGFSHSLLPALRDQFNVFWAWHDLKRPVFGVTFSPNINFRRLVTAETPDEQQDTP